MKNPRDGFLIGRLKSIRYAFKGAYLLVKTEHSVITQISIALIFVGIGLYFELTRFEWMFQFLAFGLLLSIEGLNTAVEKLCDFLHPSYHSKIGFIKDIAAGAVTFAAIATMIILLLIYSPYLYEKVI